MGKAGPEPAKPAVRFGPACIFAYTYFHPALPSGPLFTNKFTVFTYRPAAFPAASELRRLKTGTLAAAASSLSAFWYALGSHPAGGTFSSFPGPIRRRNSSSLPILSLWAADILAQLLIVYFQAPDNQFMICWNCSIFSSMATTEPVATLTVLKDVFHPLP